MAKTESVKRGRAVRYAKWCLEPDNDKVPHYVKLQAEQWLRFVDGSDKRAKISQPEYNTLCNLLRIMIHPDLNKSMYDSLEGYAWFFITAVFCTRKKGGSRYYETAVLEIARKNFKTFTSAVIFIILLLTEPRFSRFFSVAPDLSLSGELKVAIKKIIKSSPALSEDSVFKILRSEIRCEVTESEYTPLAYSKDKMDGKLANAFLADEAGAMDGYPIEAMRSSQIMLRSRLGIIISTQYPNDDNAFMDEVDMSKKALDGLLDDRTRFSLLYEPDDHLTKGDIWMTDDRVLYQANPVVVSNEWVIDDLRKKRAVAVLYENKRENFLCKHCNIKYKGLGVEGYVEITKVQQCKRKEDLEWWRGRQVYLAFDLSQTDDNTSVAMVTASDDGLYAKVWGFVPELRVDFKSNREAVDYRALIRSGVCYPCGDDVIDYSFIEDFILGIEARYGVEVIQCGYDRWNALSTVQKLEAAGMECVEIKQHSSVLHSPTKLLKEKILSQKFFYDENRMLEINFQNARCTEDTNKNKYVNKKKSAGKVDMVVSLINAVYLVEQDMLFGGDSFIAQT